MRLRRSDLTKPGYTRRRRGKGFSYLDLDGTVLKDAATIERIRALVIPPAWQDVWISTDERGHIQATGVDAAGRTQYLYHPVWRTTRDEAKFDHALQVAAGLPNWRAVCARGRCGVRAGAASCAPSPGRAVSDRAGEAAISGFAGLPAARGSTPLIQTSA